MLFFTKVFEPQTEPTDALIFNDLVARRTAPSRASRSNHAEMNLCPPQTGRGARPGSPHGRKPPQNPPEPNTKSPQNYPNHKTSQKQWFLVMFVVFGGFWLVPSDFCVFW